MAYKQVHNIKRYEGYSNDQKPSAYSESDLAPGSQFLELDTGKLFIWSTDFRWVAAPADEAIQELLGELLMELKAIRSGFELALALERGVNIDLKTEAVTAL